MRDQMANCCKNWIALNKYFQSKVTAGGGHKMNDWYKDDQVRCALNGVLSNGGGLYK